TPGRPSWTTCPTGGTPPPARAWPGSTRSGRAKRSPSSGPTPPGCGDSSQDRRGRSTRWSTPSTTSDAPTSRSAPPGWPARPGAREWDYPDMALEAGSQALADAGIPYDEVDQACVGYVYGESTCGQRAVYPLGLTGIPVYNVNNNCATGSTALFMAKQFVEGG